MTVVDKVVGALDKIAEVSTHLLFADPGLQRHGKKLQLCCRDKANFCKDANTACLWQLHCTVKPNGGHDANRYGTLLLGFPYVETNQNQRDGFTACREKPHRWRRS